MKQKKIASHVKGLKSGVAPLPVRQRQETNVDRYGMNQPGYYLIRLRLRHSEKPIRPLARIP